MKAILLAAAVLGRDLQSDRQDRALARVPLHRRADRISGLRL